MKNIIKDFRLFSKDHGVTSTTFDQYANIINNGVFNPISVAGNVPGNPMGMTPNIIEERQMNAIAMDVFSRLMMDRIIFLGLGINDQVANIVNAQLLYLESVDKAKEISMYINSPGGSVYAGLGMVDVMNLVKPDIRTVNTGISASMAYVILSNGEKGKRMSLKHARSMQHQPLGGASGQATDIEITAKEIQKLKVELYEIIAKNTGQKYEKVWADCDRDHWMTATEAKAYGVIDEILGEKKETKKKK